MASQPERKNGMSRRFSTTDRDNAAVTFSKVQFLFITLHYKTLLTFSENISVYIQVAHQRASQPERKKSTGRRLSSSSPSIIAALKPCWL
jgi:hypothetical protein